jgi:hypothetical protein
MKLTTGRLFGDLAKGAVLPRFTVGLFTKAQPWGNRRSSPFLQVLLSYSVTKKSSAGAKGLLFLSHFYPFSIQIPLLKANREQVPI